MAERPQVAFVDDANVVVARLRRDVHPLGEVERLVENCCERDVDERGPGEDPVEVRRDDEPAQGAPRRAPLPV